MKLKKDITKALKEMKIRKTGYLLDVANTGTPNSVVYDTELIRKLEVTDATIHALSWVLLPKKDKKPPEE